MCKSISLLFLLTFAHAVHGEPELNLNPAVEKALQLEVIVTLVNPTAPQFTF